jgi:hypothetical protein
MEKINKYQIIVKNILEEIFPFFESEEGTDSQLIIDEQRGHYLIYEVGWIESDWIYNSYVHIDIKPDGKVWLQHDGTDLRIGQQLIDRGIPKNDIVIGFQSPFARARMDGFAVS